MQYSLVGGEDGSNITVFISGNPPLVAHSSHPNYDAIVTGVLENDESVVDLFDIAQTASNKFERLTERVTTANGRLYLDGEEVHSSLADQVVRFLKDNVEDWKPLVAFFENVQQNPQEYSREQLYNWLTNREFTITDSGMIVGYKGVRPDRDDDSLFYSINTGKAMVNGEVMNGAIPQSRGDIVEMPRNEVTFDPETGCAQGLHVGTYNYANGFAQGALLEVHVNPRDVVSVPDDSSHEKMRVCRYQVIDTIDKPYEAPVVSDWDYLNQDDEDDDDFWGDHEDWDDFEGDLGYTAADADTDNWDNEGGHLWDDDEPVDDLESPVIIGIEGYGTVAVGDTFEDTDNRRQGRTFKVESIEGDYAVGKSLPNNVTRKVRLDRLTSRKYKKVS